MNGFESVKTTDCLTTLLKISILYRESWFFHVILIANQAA